MNRFEQAVDLHQKGGLNCAQALLTVYGKRYGIDPKMAKNIGRPLGGGIALTANVCGYLSAACILLSLAKEKADESDSRQATHPMVKELMNRFKSLHGHLLCKNLLEADMSTPEGAKKIKDEDLIAKNCYGFGRDVSQILEDLL